MVVPPYRSSELVPRSLGAALETLLGARGQAERLTAIIDHSQIPMSLVDDERRYVTVNRPARLMARSTLAELRGLRIDDLTPPNELPFLESVWERLMEAGCVAGPRALAGRNGAPLKIVYWALAEALPGRHLFAYAPADWSEDELGVVDEPDAPNSTLTPREQQVLQLSAEGLSGPEIAARLVLSPATVKTHFSNIYANLGVTGRVGAVARGMRLGLID
jgi:DNA-binding NarL/FixJ family response regulator